MRRITGLLVVFGLCSFVSQSPAAIVLSGDDTYSQVGVGLTVNTDQQTNTGGIQAIATLPAFGNSSYTKSFFTPTVLHGSYTQFRSGILSSYALGYYSASFSVSTISTYQVLGNYTNGDGLTHFHLHLYDNTTSSYLFENEQVSDGGAANFLA